MTKTVNAGPLGQLRVLRVLEDFDGPKIVGVRADSGQIYLAYWLDRRGTVEEWMFLPMTAGRYAETVDGLIDLRTAFLSAESGSVAFVMFAPDVEPAVHWRLADTLVQLGILPDEGEALLPDSLLPEDEVLVPEEEFLSVPHERAILAEIVRSVRADALQSGRERVTVRLGRHTPS